MDDLFARTQAEFDRGQDDFLTTELATCSRCVLLASSLYMGGKKTFGDRQRNMAEDAYDAANRLLTDPKYSQHLTIKAVQEFTKKLNMLRGRLDQVQRLENTLINNEAHSLKTTGVHNGQTTEDNHRKERRNHHN